MDLRELVVAYGHAEERASFLGNLDDLDPRRDGFERYEAEAAALLAELDRRLALAGNDHPIMWDSHLNETQSSIKRQRDLLRHADDDKLKGWRPTSAAAHVRADLIEEHRKNREAGR